MLSYNGQPLYDVGMAALTAFAGKQRPEELTEADLEAAAGYMAANYPRPPLRGFLTVVFPNADGFTQPAYFERPDLQQLYAQRVLYAFRTGTPTQETSDVFAGLPVVDWPLDAKDEIISGRTDRRHIPLQTGAGVINFHPEGDPGLPISGPALLAFQALPLGSAKCGGRLLAVHSDNPDILLHFAATFLAENRRAILNAQLAGDTKMPESPLRYRTLLIDTLLKASRMQEKAKKTDAPFSITAYHLSNSGQGPELDIYHLPSEIILYLQEMHLAATAGLWTRLTRAAWERPKLKRGQKEAPADFRPSRNWLYEDLFRVADEPHRTAPRFIRTYFLRRAYRYERQDETDPRGSYATSADLDLVSWRLVEPFLRRILAMHSERIKHIGKMGDALASYIFEEDDLKFYRRFPRTENFHELRTDLLRASRRQVEQGKPPLFSLHEFLSVFDFGESLNQAQWRLVRDLLLIRMVEWLHNSGWSPTQLASEDESDEEGETGLFGNEEVTLYSEEM